MHQKFNPLDFPEPYNTYYKYVVQENERLRGLIRRLEKSNQELGEELHRCKNPGEAKGWD